MPLGFGGDPVDAANVQLPFMIMFLVFATITPLIINRIGKLNPIIIGAIISLIGSLGLLMFHSTEVTVSTNLGHYCIWPFDDNYCHMEYRSVVIAKIIHWDISRCRCSIVVPRNGYWPGADRCVLGESRDNRWSSRVLPISGNLQSSVPYIRINVSRLARICLDSQEAGSKKEIQSIVTTNRPHRSSIFGYGPEGLTVGLNEISLLSTMG